MSKKVSGGWSTPKKMDDVDFVPLTPQNITEPRKYNNYQDLHENLATPFSVKKVISPRSQKGIFHSCPGLSERVEKIHKQTDDAVQNMINSGSKCVGYVSPYKATKTSCEKLEIYKTDQGVEHGSFQEGLDKKSQAKKMTSAQAAQCQDLFSAKDEIIEQKDIIMQKQKMIITQLRQTNMELEELLIQKEHQIQTNNHEKFALHLQEYQYQVSHLKQQLVEARSMKQAEVEKLQRKLGEKEYEFGKLGIKLKEMEINSSSDVVTFKKELDGKVEQLKLEQSRTDKLFQDLKLAKQENLKLHSYLEELPTAEEFKKVKTEVKHLQQEKDDSDDKKDVVQKRYKELKAEHQNKDVTCKKLQKLNVELHDQVTSLSNILGKYRARDKLGPIALEDHEQIKQENEILKKERENLKHSLEKRHKKLNRLHYDFLGKQKLFEDEKSRRDEVITSLKEELQQKSITISTLSARSQELLENNLDVQQELNKYKETYTNEYQLKLKTLLREISSCSEDVQSFVNLCASRMKGNDPSLNALLGLRDSPDKNCAFAPETCDLPNLQTIDSNINLIEQIRSHIGELRQMLSEQYAEEIGGNMCVTQ